MSERQHDQAAACLRCGHTLDHVPVEFEWELLERCPECGAYDWTPEPIHPPPRPKTGHNRTQAALKGWVTRRAR